MKELLRNKRLLNKMGIPPIQRAKLSSQIKKIETELITLSTLPDRFNKIFKETGWVAYESLNIEIMERSIEISKNESVSAGEDFLTKYYTNKEQTNFLCTKAEANLGERAAMFKIAIEDHFNRRYVSSVPLFLMIIDGFVNEEESTGFLQKIQI